MNYKIAIIVLILISSCSKKVGKSSLESPEFKDLVGTWTTNYPNDELRKIIITENGKVIIYKSIERALKIKVTSFYYDNKTIISGNDTLHDRLLSSSDGGLYIVKELNSDTAFFDFNDIFLTNSVVDTSFGLNKKVYYVRN